MMKAVIKRIIPLEYEEKGHNGKPRYILKKLYAMVNCYGEEINLNVMKYIKEYFKIRYLTKENMALLIITFPDVIEIGTYNDKAYISRQSFMDWKENFEKLKGIG